MLAALVAGAATTAYYAVPDLVASHRARAWAKAGVLAVALAASGPDLRATLAASAEEQHPDGTSSPADGLGSLPTRTKVVVAGAAAVVFAGSVVVAERWIYRRGQARAAAGKRLPHTRAALVYGALTFGLSLVPTPTTTPTDA